MNLILYALFFFSGCSALTYQLTWQRMLFTQFGVDLESVTLIISVFMFGLGMGGLWGGIIADKWLTKLLWIYVLIEIGIGLFGFASPFIIDEVGIIFFSQYKWVTAIVCFVTLAMPTILMGATFPILVTHVNRHVHNIGESVGALYCANTLGGATGAFLTGFILLSYYDLTQIIDFAACLNILIAMTAFIYYSRFKS